MPTLHLGVVDVPYAHSRRGVSTGDVATWLENRYHVFEHYWNLHQHDIAKHIETSLAGTITSLLAGAPPSIDPFGSAVSHIEDGFKQMLSTKELDRLGYPGIPTLAAQEGVSHRFKNPYKHRPPRPSFIDTGLYQSSAKAWFT
jgi:hypothetical protein